MSTVNKPHRDHLSEAGTSEFMKSDPEFSCAVQDKMSWPSVTGRDRRRPGTVLGKMADGHLGNQIHREPSTPPVQPSRTQVTGGHLAACWSQTLEDVTTHVDEE